MLCDDEDAFSRPVYYPYTATLTMLMPNGALLSVQRLPRNGYAVWLEKEWLYDCTFTDGHKATGTLFHVIADEENVRIAQGTGSTCVRRIYTHTFDPRRALPKQQQKNIMNMKDWVLL